MNKVGFLLFCSIILSCCFLGKTSNFEKKHDPSLSSLPEEVTCGVCEFLVDRIEIYLENNETQLEIIEYLVQECNLLHKDQWVTSCQIMVVAYGEQLITFTLNEESPKKACADIGLCTISDFPGKKENLESNPIQCQACTLIVKQAQYYLDKNLTEEVILGFIDRDCSMLIVKNLVDECTQLVDTYRKQILQDLSENVSPSDVCAHLKLCPTTTLPGEKAECVDYGCNCDRNAMESGRQSICNTWGGKNFPDGVIPYQRLTKNCFLQILGSGYFEKQLCLDAFANIFQQCGGDGGDFNYNARKYESSCTF